LGLGVPAITDLGLQVWEARTNLLLQSQALATSPWATTFGGITGTTVANNAGAGPDGTNTASSFAPTLQFGNVSQQVTASAGVAYTFSVWLRNVSGNTALNLLVFDNTHATQTLAPVTVTSTWARYTISYTTVAGTVSLQFGLQDRNASGFGTTLIWGAQLEQAAFAGPYIPTTSASATRGAASASVGGLSLPSEFTLFLEGATSDPNGLFPVLAQIDGAADTNRVQVFAAPGAATTVGGLRVDSGGVVQANLSSANTAANGANLRLAASIKASRMALSMNGGAVSAGSGVVPSTTTLRIGNNFGAGAAWNGNIKRAVIYPYAMSDAQLQALTQ
jgi:hypothetical protein